jgi:hypothetical protein
MTSKARTQAAKPRAPRKNRVILTQGSRQDTYRLRGKLPEPTVCPECTAVFHKGRWTWGKRPADAHEHLCPACNRIHDKFPAGWITLSGPYLAAHRDELLGLARNEEAAQRADHPLSRIMALDEKPDRVTITTTDPHLPRRIGEALHRAHDGELAIEHEKQAYLVRVTWTR